MSNMFQRSIAVQAYTVTYPFQYVRSWRLVSTLIARCQPRVVVTRVVNNVSALSTALVVTPEYRYRMQLTHLATFRCNLRTFRFIKT